MLNSIKQMCRTPIKLAGLLISVIAGTMLLVLGINLLSHTNAQLDMLENSYTTIGMVEQEKVLRKLAVCGMLHRNRITIIEVLCMMKSYQKICLILKVRITL